ncbi:MAG: serine hydrolase domain-containing protein [Bacteroidota bacterium]|nr:serine hydrolase domain-containing protein [Bacteroidota bacterium]
MKNIEQKLRETLDKSIDNKKIFGTTFSIEYKNTTWEGASGNLQVENQFFIASTTKLFVTAVILNYVSKNLIQLDAKISQYLSADILEDLHILNNVNYSSEITIKNLLAHTSGLPDYFQTKNKSGRSLEMDLKEGNDQFWTFEKCIALSKTLEPQFKPNQKGKAHYSDTNFQLLGKIIENISQKQLNQVFEELIYTPLHLSKTYLYKNENDTLPISFYYKNNPLLIPKAMTSFYADGGIVSTVSELMSFIKGFFQGQLFPKHYIKDLKTWHPIFFPMQAGVGIHRFKLPWLMNPFGTIPELIGHSGLSGTLAYYSPEKELYIVGTVNQVANPELSFKLGIKLIQTVLKAK